MRWRFSAWFLASSVWVTAFVLTDTVCLAAAAPEAAPAAATWSGNYHRARPALADLTLSQTSVGAIKVSIVAGGAPTGPKGGGTAADCTVQAEGRPSGGTLVAMVVPFNANGMTVTAADLKAAPSHVKVQLSGGHLTVESDFSGCGLGATVDGEYVPGGRGAVLTPNTPVASTKSSDITRTGMGGLPANATIAAIHASFAGTSLVATPEKGMVRIEIVGSGIAFGVAQAAAPSASKPSWESLSPDTRVTFLETTSPRFVTGDGVHVGMTLSEASDRLGSAQIVHDGQTSWARFAEESRDYDYPLSYRITQGARPTIDAIRMGASPAPAK